MSYERCTYTLCNKCLSINCSPTFDQPYIYIYIYYGCNVLYLLFLIGIMIVCGLLFLLSSTMCVKLYREDILCNSIICGVVLFLYLF